MNNFTIQLTGKKTWSLKGGDVVDPVRGYTPHYTEAGVTETQLKLHTLFNPMCNLRAGDLKFCTGDNKKNGANSTDKKNTDSEVATVTLTPGSLLYFPSVWMMDDG